MSISSIPGRLENAFYDLAQSYYHGECRRVKAHKVLIRDQIVTRESDSDKRECDDYNNCDESDNDNIIIVTIVRTVYLGFPTEC